MLRYMGIEMEKYQLKKQWKFILLANVIMFPIIMMISFETTTGVVETQTAIDIFSKTVFVVWEAALIAIMIIGEFSNKTILLMYTYPIDRRKAILSKLVLILLIATSGLFFSQILQNILFSIAHQLLPSIQYEFVLENTATFIISSVMIILLGLIPLAVGLINYSVIGTIVTSVAIICAGASSGLTNDRLFSQLAVTLIFGAIGITVAALSLRNLFNRDIQV